MNKLKMKWIKPKGEGEEENIHVCTLQMEIVWSFDRSVLPAWSFKSVLLPSTKILKLI